jgi:hypothetical protein
MIPSQDAPCMLGWKEKVTLPAWGLTLNALIDPVSPISTLAVERVDTMGHMRDSQGRRRLVLRLVVPRAQGRRGLKVVYAFYSRRTRLGEGLGRCYIVKVPLALGDLSWDAELALIPARRRQYFLRLGRSDLEGRFQVDPGLSYCHPPQRTEYSPEPRLPMPESGDPAE